MLTDLKVRNAKPQAKPYKLFDANRLFLLVAPGGGKLWRHAGLRPHSTVRRGLAQHSHKDDRSIRVSLVPVGYETCRPQACTIDVINGSIYTSVRSSAHHIWKWMRCLA